MFAVFDEMTISAFRAQLSHRWPSDRHDKQPWIRWVATKVYKEGSMEGANIDDDSLTMADADIREDERLEVVWRRVDEGEEDEVRTKRGEARKRHWRLRPPRYPAAVWHEARQRLMVLDFVAGAHVRMTQRRQAATDARRQEVARRTLEKALDKADWEERYNTIRRGRNTRRS
jgi:hypothetical protein